MQTYKELIKGISFSPGKSKQYNNNFFVVAQNLDNKSKARDHNPLA